ncbi:efflux RND transporter periplasmic adaptor subunit [Undibacterium sp. Jales W-56]|uniref:efflux RND transporter periplasmic adaptor subunit n=1 Tax=Undibacterium sp. Jales W-56 TaxID=2897325 RepID=UPI0021CE1DF7|nr:efflux RND transporter periplasmic adaptor subunit [Undibacterium sp. Jales W-56]MCU6435290.1 efflux RND transporter periplasmic adaptor subunit [Undibacterium sp. Jales W-56]
MKPTNLRLIVAGILTMIALYGCGKSENIAPAADKQKPAIVGAASADAVGKASDEGELKLSAEEIAAAGIKTSVLQSTELRAEITVTATIGANQDRFASIAPRVSGKVAKVMASLGDSVKAGQPLALIDSIEAGEAQSTYAQAVTEMTVASAAAERAEKLRADQIIPQKDALRAQADLAKARAVLRAATERRHALGLSGKSGDPSVFAVAAPFAGTVVEKKAVLGELAQPDKHLFAIADLSNVWIETNLFEKDIDKVKVGVPATVTVNAYPGQSFRGKVTYISSVMDKETRTVGARVEVPNVDGKLKLGMFASAAIQTTGAVKELMMPEDAVVLIQGQPTAFVQDGHGFASRAVQVGEKIHGQVIIKGGVRAGETIVSVGAYALKAKMLKSQISAD